MRYGRDNNRYNGGISFAKDGRCLIVCRDGRLMLYSRAVMAVAIGRWLTRAEHISMHRDKLVAARRAKPQCKRGHPRTPENMRIYNGCVACLPCQRIRDRERRARLRAA